MAGAEVKLLVAIVDRGEGSAVAEVYRNHQLPYEYLCMGRGTANSKVLDYLGLSETRKDVVLSFAPASRVREAMHAIDVRFELSRPGHGILFSVPLTGVSGQIHQALIGEGASSDKETPVETADAFDLIVVVVDPENIDTVMDAARPFGARGGTVLHGRRAGIEGGADLLGAAVEPEKDIVAMVVPRAQKLDIMRAVNKEAGAATEAHGVLFSLPVEDLMGLPRQEADGLPDLDAADDEVAQGAGDKQE